MTFFPSAVAFRAWLSEHHAERDVLWVGYWKKATGRPSLTWEESVDEALCFGWIDGLRKRVDDDAYTARFTPRREVSTWSRRNLERYDALSAEGRIEPAGSAAYAARTEAEPKDATSTLPEAFLERLRSDADAWRDWRSRPPGYRKQVARWVMSAKRASTRERRFAWLLEDSAAGRKVKPLRR